jgi:prolyl 4-hydroxylase
MASLQSNIKPEVRINSEWAPLCDSEAPNTRIRHTDSDGRPFPDNAFVLDELFSENECKALIEAAETSAGFGYTNYPKHYRGNLRLITMDKSLADVVFERLKPFMPQTVSVEGEEWEISGLNECWRLAKYHPGDRFGCHYDANYVHSMDAQGSIDAQSFFTVNVYMNGGFKGGRTRFFDKISNGNEIASVKGTPGQCLIFMQPPAANLAHDGEALGEGGLKYLFRSDVVYTKVSTGLLAACENPSGLIMYHRAEELKKEGKVREAQEIYSRVEMFYPEVAEKYKLT